MSPRVTVKRCTYDNAQRHMMAFQPISEAAHSWSYDNVTCSICNTFSLSHATTVY